MALAKAIRLGLSLMVSLLTIYLYPNSPAAAEEQSKPAFEIAVTYFYKNPKPELVATILSGFNASPLSTKPNAQPSMIGFLAGSFQRFPEDIDKMIPSGLSPAATWVTAVALHLAGKDSTAKPLFDRLVANGARLPNLGLFPTNLDAVVASGAADFDLLWGASFATGDPRYCSKILTRFAAVADVEGNAEDMVAIVKATNRGLHKDDLKWVVDKHGTEKARELIIVSSALWSLHSNAQQHDFVRAAVENYIRAHPGEPASRALLAL
jgi:hypothetical protein